MAMPAELAEDMRQRGEAARTRQLKELDNPDLTERKQRLYRRRLDALERHLELLRERAMVSAPPAGSPALPAHQSTKEVPATRSPPSARTGT